MAEGHRAAGAADPADEWHPITYCHRRGRRSDGRAAPRACGSAVALDTPRAASARAIQHGEARGASRYARHGPDSRTDRLPCCRIEGAVARAQARQNQFSIAIEIVAPVGRSWRRLAARHRTYMQSYGWQRRGINARTHV